VNSYGKEANHEMASVKLFATLATLVALYCTAVAFPLFPSALQTQPTVSN